MWWRFWASGELTGADEELKDNRGIFVIDKCKGRSLSELTEKTI